MEVKRLHVGGLHPEVTESELQERFSNFGSVDDIQIKVRKGLDDTPSKAFAYLNITAPEADIKKCIKIFDKTKWRGLELKIQLAKENFLSRLEKERKVPDENEEIPSSAEDKASPRKPFEMEVKGPPGTQVPGEEDWVVGKYGRILPVVNLKKDGTRYAKKIDPSKFVHKVKRLETDGLEMNVDVDPNLLTWQIEDREDEITKKRKGEFKDWKPKSKQRKKELNYSLEDVLKKTSAKYIFAQEDLGAGGEGDFEIVDPDKDLLDKQNTELETENLDLSRFASDSDSDNDDRKEKLLTSGNTMMHNISYQQRLKNEKNNTTSLAKKSNRVLLKEFKGTKSLKISTGSTPPVKTSVKDQEKVKSIDNKVKPRDNVNVRTNVKSVESAKKSTVLLGNVNNNTSSPQKRGVNIGQFNTLSEFSSGMSTNFAMKKPNTNNYNSSFSEEYGQSENEAIGRESYDALTILKNRANKCRKDESVGQNIKDHSSITTVKVDRRNANTNDIGKGGSGQSIKLSESGTSYDTDNEDDLHIKDSENESSEPDDDDDDDDSVIEVKGTNKDKPIIKNKDSENESSESDDDDDDSVIDVKSTIKDKPIVKNKDAENESSGDEDDDDDDDDDSVIDVKSTIKDKPIIKNKDSENESSESDDDDDDDSVIDLKSTIKDKPIVKNKDAENESSGDEDDDDNVIDVKSTIKDKPIVKNKDTENESSSSSSDDDDSVIEVKRTIKDKPIVKNKDSESESSSSSSDDDDSVIDVKSTIKDKSIVKNKDSESDSSSSDDENSDVDVKNMSVVENMLTENQSSDDDDSGNGNEDDDNDVDLKCTMKDKMKAGNNKAKNKVENKGFNKNKPLAKDTVVGNGSSAESDSDSESDDSKVPVSNKSLENDSTSEDENDSDESSDGDSNQEKLPIHATSQKTETDIRTTNISNKSVTLSSENLQRNKFVKEVNKNIEEDGVGTPVTGRTLKPEDVERHRLETVKQKHQDNLKQAATVQKALANINKGSALNKKVVFDDSDDEDRPAPKVSSVKKRKLDTSQDDGVDHSSKAVLHGKSSKEKEVVVEKKPALFDSSSSDDDSSTDEDDVKDKDRFAIRPQFEGASGSKLLELQASYGNDKRFQLDERFADGDSDEDNKKESEALDENEERQNALKILESVVGHKITTESSDKKKSKNTFKDMTSLHYDPTKEGHKEFDLTKEEVLKKNKKSKKEAEEEKLQKESGVGENPTETIQERFIEVSESFKDALSNKNNTDGSQTFSLLQAFGAKGPDEEEGVEAENTGNSQLNDKNKLPLDARFLGTDDKDVDRETEPMETSQTDICISDSLNDMPLKDKKKPKMIREHVSFFFKEEDDRLQAGTSFYRTEDLAEIREKWRKEKQDHIQRFKLKAKNFTRKMRKQPGQMGDGRPGDRRQGDRNNNQRGGHGGPPYQNKRGRRE